jgi:hypothetical protein
MEWTPWGTWLFASSVVMLVLATTAVTLRLISRGRILHVLGPTDWFIVLTLVSPPTQPTPRHTCTNCLAVCRLLQLVAVLNTVAIGIRMSTYLGTQSSIMQSWYLVKYGSTF